MSTGLFTAVLIFSCVLGASIGRWWLAKVALVLWLLGLAIAWLVGAFAATDEDNQLGVFFFTGLPTVFWPLGVGFGVLARRLRIRRAS